MSEKRSSALDRAFLMALGQYKPYRTRRWSSSNSAFWQIMDVAVRQGYVDDAFTKAVGITLEGAKSLATFQNNYQPEPEKCQQIISHFQAEARKRLEAQSPTPASTQTPSAKPLQFKP